MGEGHAQLFAQLFAQMYPLVQACERLADAKHGQKAVLDALLHSEFNPAQQDLLVNQFFRIVEKYLGPAQQAIIEMISAMRESQIPEKITSERKEVSDVPEGDAVPEVSQHGPVCGRDGLRERHGAH